MNQNNQNFQAATVGKKFENTRVRFDNLLAQENNSELTAIRNKFHEELKEYREQGFLTVAFVGQYNAGKSTTISALTGRRDIRIDSDIATDKTASYDWNGIKLIDTPGLFTDRQDHDETTYDAINKADLLIFCLTYMLFDSWTAENFKKLAYEKGYRWKMMLVVNKMSDEAGEEEQKITNYRKSLAAAIEPHSLDEFPLCFIDAKDYCDGIDEDEEFLVEISRFQTFIDALNKFVEHRAALTRLDTPVRIALACVDEAEFTFKRNSNQDSTYLEVLNRLSRTVQKERDRLQTKVKSIALEMSSAVAKEGITLAAEVGSNQAWEMLNNQAELNVRKHYEKAETKLQDAIDVAFESVKQEVEEVLTSNLVKTFVACLEKNQNISTQNLGSGMDMQQIKGQVNQIKIIGEIAGVQLTNLATRSFVKTAGQQSFLRSMDVVGSGLHQSVLAVGKFAGFKFKPWQAIGVAKNVGNFAKFLGPAIGAVSVGAELLGMHQEQQREKQMADIRREITSQFQLIAKDLENQLEIQLYEFEKQVYGDIENKIAAAHQQEATAIATSDTRAKKLSEIRRDFQEIIEYIKQASETKIV